MKLVIDMTLDNAAFEDEEENENAENKWRYEVKQLNSRYSTIEVYDENNNLLGYL